MDGITTNSKSTSIPSEHLIPPPLSQPVQRYSQLNDQPTFFQRVAGWFGFGGGNNYSEIKSNASPIMMNDDQSQAKQNVIQERYIDLSIPSAHQSIQQPQLDQTKQKPKSGCNPCNKVPWMPMFGGQHQAISVKGNVQKGSSISTQYQQLKPQYNQPSQYHHLQLQHPPPFQYTNPKVQSFNIYPNNPHQQGPQLQHITLPTYTPPLIYSTPHSIQANGITSPEYQPPHQLLPIQQPQHHLIPIPLPNLSVTPIPPLYDTKPFNIQPFSHNNLQSYVVPIQYDNIPVQTNAIPIPVIQNPIYSVHQQVPQINNDQLHYRTAATTPSSDIEIVKSVSLGEFTSTIEYPPSIVQSPVIDLSDNTGSLVKEKYSQPEYLSEPIVVDSNERDSGDSLSSASSKNFTIQKELDREKNSEHIKITPTKSHVLTTLRPKPFKSGDSHGRIKTDVDIEASVQTENEKSKPTLKKDRETPKDLLDSPIFYLKKTSLTPTTKPYSDITKVIEVGTTKPVIDYSPWSPSTHTGIYTTLAYAPSSTTISPVSSTFVPVDSNGANSGMSPPPLTVDKKPKQIQIIIPYTNKNQPRPFRANKFQNFDTSSGWSHQTNNNDYQDSQESQVVTATVTQAPVKKTTKYLTKILASSLRDLLKKEKSNYTTIDLSKLQKNIDGWTEQEFSMVPNKASTISFRGHSKHIPSEYLTTTTPIQQFTTTTDMVPTTSLEPLYADEEYKKVDNFGKGIDENRISVDGGKYTTILPMPFKPKQLTETHELWNKLNVAISPVTKEKVYVVTPQPWKEYNQDESDLFGTFKSPRFSVRPTPGIATTASGEQKLTLPESGNNLYLYRNRTCNKTFYFLSYSEWSSKC